MALAEQVDFDLRSFVQQALDRSKKANPHEVADEIAGSIPVEHLRAAVYELLPAYVVPMVGRNRAATMRAASDDEAPKPSARWAAAARTYQGILGQRMLGADEWKFLGDFTRDDLAAAAERRRAHAAGVLHEAERFETLAKKMQRRKATKVADLPDDVVREVLS